MPKTHRYSTIPLKEARLAGYKPLTYPYTQNEYPMMDRVIRDLNKGPRRIEYAIVTEDANRPDQLSVFRKSNSLAE